MYGDTVVILPPCKDILETLRLTLHNFSCIIIMYFGCCYLVYLSSKLVAETDFVLFCCFTVSSVSVPEEYLDLSNEVILFNAMSLSDSLLIGFLFLVLDDCFQNNNSFFDRLFCCRDQWIIRRHDPLS